jgi:4-amino-4-deoxy-L-arabinose transferase-like glycosyltransferase
MLHVELSKNKILQGKPGLHIPLWLIWGAALVFVCTALGGYGILDNNEGLYAEIPREMLASHDWRQWVIPHLNGLPYMEKPPLLYWLTALSFSLFGISEWSARLVPALSALACVALLINFGNAVRKPQVGRLAALMFVSGIGVAVMSRTLMFDMLLTATLTAALMFAYRYFVEHKLPLLRWMYASLALAVMAKGAVALVLFGAVMLSLLVPQMFREGLGATLRCWLRWQGLLIFLAIAVPWHVAASLVEPIFPWFYFINEHILRFLGKREPHDYYSGPWWYYLPRMLIYLFPWSFLILGLLQRSTQSAGVEHRDLSRFLLFAWVMPLLFFSVSSAKANYYLIVVMPFAACQLALALEKRDYLSARMRALPGVLIALLTGVAYLAILKYTSHPLSEPVILGQSPTQFVQNTLVLATAIAVIGAIVAWRWARVGVQIYVLISMLTAGALLVTLPAMEADVSAKPLANYLNASLPARTVYLYHNFEEQSSLPFYLQHKLPVIDSRSNDLFWGNKLQPNDWMISGTQFAQMAEKQAVVVIVMKRQLKDFEADPLSAKLKELRRMGPVVLFVN